MLVRQQAEFLAVFLSTPSARRATGVSHVRGADQINFYPRPLRGGRRITDQTYDYVEQFLSTPSARRATQGARETHLHQDQFLSTPSARRATVVDGDRPRDVSISIHALCEEASTRTVASPVFYFYPRPLRGGRPEYNEDMKLDELKISIHALCEEGDLRAASSAAFRLKFLSTPSARRATIADERSEYDRLFLSTPSARRATQDHPRHPDHRKISIHALCEEGDAVSHQHSSL